MENKLDMALDDIVQRNNQGRRGRGGRGGRRSSGSRYQPYERNNSTSAPNEEGTAPVNTTRVYVGNLSWETAWQELKDHMRQAGNVIRADILMEPSGRSKGCGIVEFDTPEAAAAAINTLSQTTLGGRTIYVREDREQPGVGVIAPVNVRPQRPPPPPLPVTRGGYAPRGRGAARAPPPVAAGGGSGRQVYVGNLAWTTAWQDLKDHFRQAGNVIRADVLLDGQGRSKGSGTVLFESKADADRAIEMFNETDFQGRTVYVHADKYA